MKKKFVLTLALVLMVVVGLSAATPVEVSGSFKAGYEFKFASTNAFKADNDSNFSTVVDFTGDFWKVSVDSGQGNLFADEQGITATAELYLDKALAEQGTDMGDIALTLHVGDGVSTSAPTVLADVNEFRFRDGLGLAMTASDNFGITLGYASLVTVYFSADPTVANALPMVVGATVTPIDGVSVAVGFTNDFAGNNGLVVSAAADLAALAGLDIALDVTGEFLLDLDTSDTLITADASTTIAGIGLWVAYFKNATDVNALAVKASYETAIEAFTVGGSVKAQMNDLSDIAGSDEYTIAAYAKYAMGGATYALDASYAITAEEFILSPSVTIAF